MVERGGGKKTSNQKIAPGRLWSCAQANRSNLYRKQNGGVINNNINPLITDDIALMVARNLDRQRKGCTPNTPTTTQSPNCFHHVSSPTPEFEDTSNNNDVGNGVGSTQHDDNDQAASQGVIPSMAEGLIGKIKRESNFVSRIKVALKSNNAIDPRPREDRVQNEVDQVNGDGIIQEKFEITQCGDYLRMHMFIVETMQRLYRLFKCRLHSHYKKCGKTDDERIKNPPPDLSLDQWKYLVEHFGSDKFKIMRARNSKNRNSEKRVKHTIRTLSFPESEDILGIGLDMFVGKVAGYVHMLRGRRK